MAADSNRLKRSISLSNMEDVHKIHQSIANDKRQGPEQAVCYFDVFTAFSFLLPMTSLEGESPELRHHVLSGIQDQGMQRRLVEEGTINWTPNCLQLYCLWTKGDGNCLMHAASLAMWGIHDSHMILRAAVYEAMKSGPGSTLYRRWVQARRREMHQLGASLDDSQKGAEWRRVVEMCNPMGYQGRMESLEEFHIFVLANVLRRPIIVCGLPKVRSFASGGTLAPCSIPGIYLPLLWTPDCVSKNPICLGYAGSHFTALVPSDVCNTRYPPAFPVCNKHGVALPVHFLLEEEFGTERNCKNDYMIVEHYPSNYGSSTATFEAAQVSIKDQPAFLKSFWSNYVRQCKVSFGNASAGGIGSEGERDQRSRLGSSGRSPELPRCPICNSPGGGPEKSFLCSDCYSVQLQAAGGPSTPADRPPRGDRILDEAQDPSLPPPLTTVVPEKCRRMTCELYGSPQNEGYCSKCYQELLMSRRARSGSQSSQQAEAPQPPLCKQCQVFEGIAVFGGLCTGCHSKNIHPRDIPSTAGSSVIGYLQQANLGGEGGANGSPTHLNQHGQTKHCTRPNCNRVRDPGSDQFCFDHFAEDLSNPLGAPRGIERCTYGSCSKTADPSAKLLCTDHFMQGLEGNLPGFDMGLIMLGQSRQGGQGSSARQQHPVKMGGAGFDNGEDLPPPLAVPRADPAQTGPTPLPRRGRYGLPEIDQLNIAGKVSEPSKMRCFMCQGFEPAEDPAGVIVCSDHAREMHEMRTGVQRRLTRESGKCCVPHVGALLMRKPAFLREECDSLLCDSLT